MARVREREMSVNEVHKLRWAPKMCGKRRTMYVSEVSGERSEAARECTILASPSLLPLALLLLPSRSPRLLSLSRKVLSLSLLLPLLPFLRRQILITIILSLSLSSMMFSSLAAAESLSSTLPSLFLSLSLSFAFVSLSFLRKEERENKRE